MTPHLRLRLDVPPGSRRPDPSSAPSPLRYRISRQWPRLGWPPFEVERARLNCWQSVPASLPPRPANEIILGKQEPREIAA